MAIDPKIQAENRETAIILIEEGKKQFAANDIAAARASFKEAAGLDPNNRQVWLCLASVTSGSEREQYLKRAGGKKGTHSVQKTEPVRVPTDLELDRPAHQPSAAQKPLLIAIFGLAGLMVIGLLVVSGIFGYKIWMQYHPTPVVVRDETTTVKADTGANINFQNKAGLYIPARSLFSDEQFVLSTPEDAPAFSETDLFTPIGDPVKVSTTATVLRQPVWVGFRYDPAKLPSNVSAHDIQVARWDGNTWEIVDSENNTNDKLIYVPITHFSEPLFRLVVWAPSAASSVLDQVNQANKTYYQNPEDSANASQYEKIIRQVSSVDQLKALSSEDQRGFWIACNMWGESLYKSGQYSRSGEVFQSCVLAAIQAGVDGVWNDHMLSSPGYALSALQNRFPLGVHTTQAIYNAGWAANIPINLLTLSSESFTWRYDSPAELSDLPDEIRSSIESYEAKLDRKANTSISTSVDLLVLTPQAQEADVMSETMTQIIQPYVLSSGISDIPGSAIKADAAGLESTIQSLLNQKQTTNAYVSDPVVYGEDRHVHAPMILLKVERAWEGPNGLTHSQYIFTIAPLPESLGVPVGAPLADDTSFENKKNEIQQSTVQHGWVELGATLTKDIQAVHVYNESSLAVGSDHTCALTKLNGVQCWGNNQYGQLGTGDTSNSASPRDVVDMSYGIAQITAGETHTCALTKQGKVLCWGNNSSGQLGTGDNTTQLKPVQVTGLDTPVTAIAAGALHTCALTSDGRVYCWGNNLTGQLGNGSTDPSLTPVLIDGFTGVKQIAAGASHTCALTDTGAVKCWGANNHGQLGNSTQTDSSSPVDVPNLSDVVEVTAGQEHTCVVDASGGVKCWGLNASGQVGNGSTDGYISNPVDVSSLGSGVLEIKAYKNQTCALKKTGILCWGLNNAGQLGNGDTNNQLVPVSVLNLDMQFIGIGLGADHTCARASSGFIYCWGGNTYGQLGNRTNSDSRIPVIVTGFGMSVADAAGKIEISPAADQTLELGSTIHVKAVNLSQDIPAGVKQVQYQASLNGGTFVNVGEVQGADTQGVDLIVTGVDLGKTVAFKVLAVDNQGTTTEYTTHSLTVVDTRKPTAAITISPADKVIELGDSITFAATDVNDTVEDVRGSGVKEITFKVLEDGAETFSNTVSYTAGDSAKVTWPVPLSRKNHNTLVTFKLIVTDQAGNQAEITDSGYTLSDRVAPSFAGALVIGSDMPDKFTGDRIEMGSKLTVSTTVYDQFDGGKQGSGIREADFYVSSGGGSYVSFDRQVFTDAATTKTIQSNAWDSKGVSLGTSLQFKARIVDVAGNATEQLSGTYILDDTTDPEVGSLSVDPNPVTGTTFTVNVGGIGDGLGSGIQSAELTVKCGDDAAYAPITINEPGSSISQPVTLVPSANCHWSSDIAISLVVKDGKPNSTTKSMTVKDQYDIKNPAVAITPLSNEGVISGNSLPNTISPVSIIFSASDALGESGVKFAQLKITCNGTKIVDGNPDTKDETAKSNYSGTDVTDTFSWTPPNSGDTCPYGGILEFTITVTDQSGKTGEAKVNGVYEIDTALPTIVPDITNDSGIPEIKATVRDGESGVKIDSVKVNINNVQYDPAPDPASDIFSFAWPVTQILECGDVAVHFEANDNAGNSVSKEDQVMKYDFKTPTVTLTPEKIENYGNVHLTATLNALPCGGANIFKFSIGLDENKADKILTAERSGLTIESSEDWPLPAHQTGKDTIFVTLAIYNAKNEQIYLNDDLSISYSALQIPVDDQAFTYSQLDTASKTIDLTDYVHPFAGSSLSKWAFSGTSPDAGCAGLDNKGILTVTPSGCALGNTAIAVKVEDDMGGSGVVNVALTIQGNNAPVVTGFTKSVLHGSTLTFGSVDFSGHFSDADSTYGDSMAKIVVTPASDGILYYNGVEVPIGGQEIPVDSINKLTFDPDDAVGSASFSWKADDQHGENSNSATVTITIEPLPEPAP
jgi:alpha-tubulin suppressor-like RCC1 family protein